MKATRLHPSPTLYDIESERLCCSLSSCDFSSTAAYKWAVGDKCPSCEKNAVITRGVLEYRHYHVDLVNFEAIGQCDCENFRMVLKPQLDLLSRTQRAEVKKDEYQCKHIKLARDVAKSNENFDALLLALPDQNQDQFP